MNRRFTHNLNIKPPAPPSPYAGVRDEDLVIMVEQRIAKALSNPPPQFAPPPTSEALAALQSETRLLRPWAEALPDPRVRKIAIAAVEKREAQVAAGIEAYLSSDALPHVPPLPLIPVP